jgi:hypothetical protein
MSNKPHSAEELHTYHKFAMFVQQGNYNPMSINVPNGYLEFCIKHQFNVNPPPIPWETAIQQITDANGRIHKVLALTHFQAGPGNTPGMSAYQQHFAVHSGQTHGGFTMGYSGAQALASPGAPTTIILAPCPLP